MYASLSSILYKIKVQSLIVSHFHVSCRKLKLFFLSDRNKKKNRDSFIAAEGFAYTRLSSNLDRYNSTLDFQFTERIRDFDCSRRQKKNTIRYFSIFTLCFIHRSSVIFPDGQVTSSLSSSSSSVTLAVPTLKDDRNCYSVRQEKQVQERISINLTIFEENYLSKLRPSHKLIVFFE